MSCYDMVTKHHLPRAWATLPEWMLQAAEEGKEFAQKCFTLTRYPRPMIKWYLGGPGWDFIGFVHLLDRNTVWLDASMRSFDEVLEVSAHEHAHALGGCEDEDVPTLVGLMAVKNRREGTVYIHHGDLKYYWLPAGLTEIPSNAMVLEFEDHDVGAYVNRGTGTRPLWRKVNL